ncbi:gas vesicle protein GvpJ [Kribbella sp. VKM Ac-2566]|uniref:gas vesicle protein GvpJ n=1 Tax=Kribbella sp. VKM Ac-2566 TaxID=2512218 RepID=UPI001062A292|nr:gas vesicle protein GvpJ [Kribbella sp. VKM Ac-2566]TDW98615.1 gas vesicle protein GvpA/GvpJ/GvpM family [Kribbella sp. VKM Ac-2566]
MTVQTQTAVTTEPSLVDLLDRLLGKGVVVTGDVVVSLAGVDLVRIQLSAVIGSVRKEMGNL